MKKFPVFTLAIALVFSSCKRDKGDIIDPPVTDPGLTASTPVYGYGMLNRIKGIWSGPVTSTTSLGGFPDWTVDLRPIAPGHISSKSELDSLNDIFMSFFVTRYNNEYRIAFRNGGGFAGSQRISYLQCDSVSETAQSAYYRFSDFVAGQARAWSEFRFSNDSLYMRTYTSRYNTVAPAQLHMTWTAKLKDSTSAHIADSLFDFPRKVLAKDLSNAFSTLSESIFFNTSTEPYPENDQPYLGKTTVNISFSGAITPAAGTKNYVIFTTQPLFSGFSFLSQNLKFRSRYVMLPAEDNQYQFTYMHPGTYYAYVLHDANGDGNFTTGDHINTPLSTISFTLSALGTETVNVQVNFTIP